MVISSFQIFSETFEVIFESFLYTLYPIIQKAYFYLQNTSKTQTHFTNSTWPWGALSLAWLITIVSAAVLASILNLTTIYSYFSQREILYTRFCHSSEQSSPMMSYLKSKSHNLHYGLSLISSTLFISPTSFAFKSLHSSHTGLLLCTKHTKSDWYCLGYWFVSPSAWKYLFLPSFWLATLVPLAFCLCHLLNEVFLDHSSYNYNRTRSTFLSPFPALFFPKHLCPSSIYFCFLFLDYLLLLEHKFYGYKNLCMFRSPYWSLLGA